MLAKGGFCSFKGNCEKFTALAERGGIGMDKQICFITTDGYMVCNTIYRNGKLIRNKSGKWFRFLPKKKTKRS